MSHQIVPEIYYAKPRRFPRPGEELPSVHANRYLSPVDASYLMRGKVLVEEKMDGTPVTFFASGGYVIFAEDLRRKHSIFYRLPARYAIFDIFDINRGVFIFSEEKSNLCTDIRKGFLRIDGAAPTDFFPVAVVASGLFPNPSELVPLIGISRYATDEKTGENTYMEGIVIKPDRDLYPEEQVRGKIVRPEFEDGIEEHYLRLPEVRNIIDPRVNIVMKYTAPASR